MNKESKLNIQFLGGAGTVTGSKTLVEFNGKRILIDCGLFQGLKKLRKLNWKELEFDAKSIDAIILTHGHLDHCGYIPVLVKNGFTGSIHCTQPTMELTEIILKDSAKIQEEDAERANRHAYSKRKNCQPLYTIEDAEKSIDFIKPHNYDQWIIINSEFKFQLLNAGHILGSAMIELKVNGEKLLFTGDIGRKNPMLLYPPKKVNEVDYLIIESTYGDRIHKDTDPKEALLAVIKETYHRGGILMVPSFAVERTQELIYLIHLLKEEGSIPNIPVYLDSPMGVKSTLVFEKYPKYQDLSKFVTDNMYSAVKFISSYQESKLVVADKKPKIILAGSGMLEGGRMLHYIANHGKSQKNTILFVGFQAVGTRGRDLVQGTKQIKFFGEYYEVECEIKSISSMSAHGDRNEMLDWMKNIKNPPKKVFLNHGEPHQTNAFRVLIESELNWNIHVPELDEKIEL